MVFTVRKKKTETANSCYCSSAKSHTLHVHKAEVKNQDAWFKNNNNNKKKTLHKRQ